MRPCRDPDLDLAALLQPRPRADSFPGGLGRAMGRGGCSAGVRHHVGVHVHLGGGHVGRRTAGSLMAWVF